MAKERKNQLKKQKTPLLSVFKNLARKLTYLLLVLSLIFVIYLIDRSNLLDPKISWEINNQLVASSNRYESLINPLINNKYLVNLNHIKEKVKESPWVSNAKVQRIFWNQIKVSIQELSLIHI